MSLLGALPLVTVELLNEMRSAALPAKPHERPVQLQLQHLCTVVHRAEASLHVVLATSKVFSAARNLRMCTRMVWCAWQILVPGCGLEDMKACLLSFWQSYQCNT